MNKRVQTCEGSAPYVTDTTYYIFLFTVRCLATYS